MLRHDIGNPIWLPFYEALAEQFTVYVPSHPGYGKSDRTDWMRNIRDLAVVQQTPVKDLKLDNPSLVGLGFGGWVAAEMASMSLSQYKRLALVGAMEIQPNEGEIVDQFVVSATDYIKDGFFNTTHYEAQYGSEPDIDQLVACEFHRKMTARIAGKPYMFNQGLPHRLGGVETPALVVWGNDGQVDHADSVDCIHLLGQEVMPAIREIRDKLGLKSPLEANSPGSLVASQYTANVAAAD